MDAIVRLGLAVVLLLSVRVGNAWTGGTVIWIKVGGAFLFPGHRHSHAISGRVSTVSATRAIDTLTKRR